MSKMAVDTAILQKLLNYLQERPYREVRTLIDDLMDNAIDLPEEENGEEQEDNDSGSDKEQPSDNNHAKTA